MNIGSRQLIGLAVGLAAGSFTEEAIRSEYGDDILGKVLAIASGFGVGVVAEQATEGLLNTEIGRDITDTIDEALDATVGEAFRGVSDLFDW